MPRELISNFKDKMIKNIMDLQKHMDQALVCQEERLAQAEEEVARRGMRIEELENEIAILRSLQEELAILRENQQVIISTLKGCGGERV